MRVYRKRNLPAEHGTETSYQRGCKCVPCKKAHATYYRAYRKLLGKEYVRGCNLKYAHGLSLEDYAVKLTEQGGVCASCGLPETKTNQFGVVALAVDHDHDTGRIRGLLCMKCNRALGLLGDSATTVASLLVYRRKY